MKKPLIIFLAVLVPTVFWSSTKELSDKTSDQNKHKRPQEYMTQVSINSFTENGQLKDQLSAEYWAYLPETQSSILSTPHLTVYRPDNTIWLIDAKQGQIQQPTIGVIQQIELRDTVVLHRPQTETTLPITIETSELHYHPKAEFAETEKAVTLTKPGLKITGVGLNAYLQKSWVELLHQVKTIYAVHTN